MASYDIRPLQLRVLEIVKAVDTTCRQHNLRYYIWAGTMIGAIRHKGFIPWDDDLDIAMPRADYNMLIAHAREWLPEQYEMVCAETDDTYPLPFAKIQDAGTTLIERLHLHYLGGIYIDVFPIDGTPCNPLKRRMHFARYEYYKRVLYLLCRDPYKRGHGPSSWAPLLCRKLYTLKGVQHRIKQLLEKYAYDESSQIADYDDGLKGVMPKHIVGNPTPFTFEGVTLKGVEYYDVYLTKKYGDYMSIPPHSDRHQHNFQVLDLEKPYREYRS